MTKNIQLEKTEFSDYLWKTFNWFSVDFAQKVQNACAEFFGLNLDMKLFSIGENSNVLFRGDKYFVTEIKVTKNLSVGIRLSQKAVGSILKASLGDSSSKPFVMEKMSELDAKIITAFNDFLYSNLSKVLVEEKQYSKGT